MLYLTSAKVHLVKLDHGTEQNIWLTVFCYVWVEVQLLVGW